MKLSDRFGQSTVYGTTDDNNYIYIGPVVGLITVYVAGEGYSDIYQKSEDYIEDN